ncbi:parathyroid hormone 4 [Chiloscyllium plagiosum]|uniref:parathyroid hormone 4 n=1 Tax=Chiloscyllium plagiosum TaxID=36176 RepID=UPI001CB7E022|nr:parathyroid hormone 4 [Chiloscyllium plagiosum]XP_043572228.1 parathyroid hormone 4 [Chiloscyllium plagiosum]
MLFPGQALTFTLIILLCSSVRCQNTVESKRTVTEHQLLHDKGRTMEQLKRLMWLNNAMSGVHTASRRRWPSAGLLSAKRAQQAECSSPGRLNTGFHPATNV